MQIVTAGPEDAAEVLQVMRSAFEEYRGRLHPDTGALSETVEDVQVAIKEGGALIAYAANEAVGAARFAVRPGYLYAERIGVTPGYRDRGVAVALMNAIEDATRSLGLAEVRLGVRASLPGNLRFYENLGYRALESKAYPEGTDFEITLSKTLVSAT
ncbi:MAG: GNAT family N-acetyltransferase [Dehalococcoidia bacterium]